MTIEQEGRVYTVRECEGYWSMKRPLGERLCWNIGSRRKNAKLWRI